MALKDTIDGNTRIPLYVVAGFILTAFSSAAGYTAAINSRPTTEEVAAMLEKQSAANDRAYYSKSDGSRLEGKIDLILETVKDLKEDQKKEK